MKKNEDQPRQIARLATGIAGFDEVTGGGLLKAGVYIFQGAPGAGKTILANHIVHNFAAAGGKVVYVTMLAESHARLLQHMACFRFFDTSAIPEQVCYVSAFNALRAEGLKGVVSLLRNEMRSRTAGLVVLDGLVMAASAANSDEDLKVFVSEIQAHSALTGCTTLLLTSDDADRPVAAEHTMVDGILLLRERAFGPRRQRSIEVAKFRGSATLRGNHAFGIGEAGITVYPRLEAARRESGDEAVQPVPVPTGVPELDRMFEIGGYPKGGVVAISGVSGAGKTMLALHYLAAARAGEKTLFVSFYESPELLARIARMAGMTGAGSLRRHAEFMWRPFGENGLDELCLSILDRIARLRAERVVIDGIGALMASTGFQERGEIFLAAFANELRRTGATAVLTVEQQDASRALSLNTATMSALADVVVDLRLEEDGGVARRFLAVRKSRMSLFERVVREIVLTPKGLSIVGQEAPGGR
jgi:circadian clock protein KaiC